MFSSRWSRILIGESRRNGGLYHCMLRLERETRVELATLCLGSRCSTTELLPLAPMIARRRGADPSWRPRRAQAVRTANVPDLTGCVRRLY